MATPAPASRLLRFVGRGRSVDAAGAVIGVSRDGDPGVSQEPPSSTVPKPSRRGEGGSQVETVIVRPDQVFPAPRSSDPAAMGPAPVLHSFFAPIVLVTALSAVLLTVFLIAIASWLWLQR